MSKQIVWEYCIIRLPGDQGAQSRALAACGLLGWELVSIAVIGPDWIPLAYFKRLVP